MASHLRSSIPGFSMLTSPTVACGSIYQILKNGPSSPACKVRKPPSARHQSRSCWSSYSQCSLLRWTSLGEPFFSLEFERGCFFIFSSPLKLKRTADLEVQGPSGLLSGIQRLLPAGWSYIPISFRWLSPFQLSSQDFQCVGSWLISGHVGGSVF